MSVNDVGRRFPTLVNGRSVEGFRGIGGFIPKGRHHGAPIKTCRDFSSQGDKTVESLVVALRNAGLRDGMRISTHHHFRNGDLVAEQLFQAAEQLGVRDLVWFPSAVFPCHESLLRHIHSGLIHHIEGSLNGPVGEFASAGKMPGLAVLRSHGSRYRAIQDGDALIDIAVIAAPSCDAFGNMTGAQGPAACGGLGFATADAQFADHVIAITDHLVPFPCAPWQIPGNYVDQVVVTDRIGDPTQIVSGTTRLTRSPERLLIAKKVADFVGKTGVLHDGWSFQAGAGGISLAFAVYIREIMRERGLKARFIRGGSTEVLVEMLEEGLTEFILDGQTFDLEGVRSLRENPNHLMTSPFTSYNYHSKGNIASMISCALLGATEVDLNFNANVVSHSDGRMLHGIGGWQDALFSECTILALPAFRNRVPVVRESLTTFCGPGELIDVVVTERGTAVNPRRQDLIQAATEAGVPLTTLQAIKQEVEAFCGGPPEPASLTGRPVGVVTWVDGTIIDSLYEIP